MAPASINTAVRETPASEAAGPLSGCRPRSSSHSLMIFLSGPGRRRTSPARASSRQIWLTLCRGEMPVWSASWSSSRGREPIRIASMMRSRWLPGCMTASMLPRGRGCAIRRNRPGSPRLKDHSRKTLTTRDMQSATCAMAAAPCRLCARVPDVLAAVGGATDCPVMLTAAAGARFMLTGQPGRSVPGGVIDRRRGIWRACWHGAGGRGFRPGGRAAPAGDLAARGCER